MRESCSYGSVRERGGNEPLYSEVGLSVMKYGEKEAVLSGKIL